MDEYISRQAAIDAVQKYKCEHGYDYADCACDIEKDLKALPSAQPETDGFCTDCKEYDQERHFCPRFDRVIKTTIDEMKTEQRWIPCSERLPEDGRQVLVYARSVHYALAKYDEMREADGTYKKQWVTFDAWKPFYTIKEVIAWMPLPEPYQKEGEQDALN